MQNTTDNHVSIDIDLGINRRGQLNESWLITFGWAVKSLLKHMFGGTAIPTTIRGTHSEIKTFANTLNKERRFIDAFQKYGLDDPITHKSKYRLKQAVGKFEDTTGLQWPFK